MFMLSSNIYLRISLVFSSIPLFGLMHICFDECNEGCEDMKTLSKRNGIDWVNNESEG